ncbi:MAG: sigma-54-dependent Fis family transcriptional regulator [Candidatus Eisenbacteria bacterium]|uniref:Sigma-54-dependent Fis family transcriptional regulator n=1 Tax=Eiseniibacteriota bacterium TaxID=2212470 RepID=A0A938BL91_UNCEI|nr:sigma-54-dependent Fis family transcriptional regulator [Candidatus Eisenbacteria bacterium]
MTRVLIIDDREDMLGYCRRTLSEAFTFQRAGHAAEAGEMLAREAAAAVLLDLDFSHADPQRLLGPREDVRREGFHILAWLRRAHARIPVVMVTARREMSSALRAAELGADYLAWDDVLADPEVLRARLEHAWRRVATQRDPVLAEFRALGVVVESPAFARALVALHEAIPGTAPILLAGESGTGKDVLARAAHDLAGGATRPYIHQNLAAIAPNVFESELFGHVRGAFTGAVADREGMLRAADGGTLFLNEIAELPVSHQAKLLTALERYEVVPIGGVRGLPARFRLIAATSQDLAGRIEQGLFRRDLFHRIAAHTIVLPPLRERREDIPALVAAFLRPTAGPSGSGRISGIAREAVEYLTEQRWEGNVRHLRNVIDSAAAHGRGMITLADVREAVLRFERLHGPVAGGGAEGADLAEAGEDRLRAHEEALFARFDRRELLDRYFLFLYRTSGGNLPEVARRAGVAKSTVYEWQRRCLGDGRE